MQIFHEARATSTTHDGVEYEADEDGVIEVPHEAGVEITKRAGWHQVGWKPELTPEQREIQLYERVDALEVEVADLKAALAKRSTSTKAASKE